MARDLKRGSRATKNRRGEVVYCLDIGMLRIGPRGGLADTTFAWARIFDGEPESGRSPHDLRDRLVEDLGRRRLVALGVEAPMWYPIPALPAPRQPGHHWDLFGPRFAAEQAENCQWYLQAGASACVRAAPTIVAIVGPVLMQHGVQFVLTFHDWANERDSVLVWEAFVAGAFKPDYANHADINHDEADVRAAAQLFAHVRQLQELQQVETHEYGPLLVAPRAQQGGEPENTVFSVWSQAAAELGLATAACKGSCMVIGAHGGIVGAAG